MRGGEVARLSVIATEKRRRLPRTETPCCADSLIECRRRRLTFGSASRGSGALFSLGTFLSVPKCGHYLDMFSFLQRASL